MMKKYIIGASYSKDRSKIALIKKNRPDWQAGKFNFIGGHLETYDSKPVDGIVREFNEETGVFIGPKEWQQFGTLSGPDYDITLFKTFTDAIFDVKTITDEAIHIFDTNNIPFEDCISNLKWLVPMSLEIHDKGLGQPMYEVWTKYPEQTKPKRKLNLTLNVDDYNARYLDELRQAVHDATPAQLTEAIQATPRPEPVNAQLLGEIRETMRVAARPAWGDVYRQPTRIYDPIAPIRFTT